LQLEGEPRTTQVPPYSTVTSPQCDDFGEVYLTYSSQADTSRPATLASIESDGTTQTVNLQWDSGSSSERHVFLYSAANDGSLHQIARVPDASDQDGPATQVEYVTFDSEGSLGSQARFEQQFIPSLLVPLPNGNFFASGVSLKEEHDDVQESALVGIFNSDAKLVKRLRDRSGKVAGTNSDDGDGQETETAFSSGIGKLGSDRNIYVLLLGDHARIAVISQSGRILRQMNLQEPFETDVAHDMWISSNRILVVYEGEANDSKDAYVYVLYDAQSGNVIRVYRPEFSGTVACFQDGQTLSVLLQQPSSGKISLGTAELQ
jgi:hypothetical protein